MEYGEKVTQANKKQLFSIYLSSGIVSICGIVYQVLYGAVGSYLFGDGVLFYSITIGLFLMGMGIGASLSERIHNRLISTFVQIEYLIALIGGLSTLGAFYTLAQFGTEVSQLYLYLVITLTGALTGLELPILIRKAEEIGEESRKSVARVLLSDYGFSLIGAVGFACFYGHGLDSLRRLSLSPSLMFLLLYSSRLNSDEKSTTPENTK